MIEIKHKNTGEVLFAADVETIVEAVEQAVRDKANLSSADLSWANLSSANLGSADLRWANLSSANLRWANLSWANLSSANLRWADLRWADLSWAKGFGPESIGLPPANKSLLRQVCEQVVSAPESLNMHEWHTCETTHCLSGWAIHLSGPAGYALEKLTSADVAGRILIPDAQHLFHELDHEKVLAWCREQLAEPVNN